MTTKTPRYPDLRRSIEVVLEAVGYRLPHNTTIFVLAGNAFQCSPSGVTKRLNGGTGVGPEEMSRLVQQATIARDGIGPEHFHNGPEALRQALRDHGVGLYGRSLGTKLHRAVRDFQGARGEIRVRPRRALRAGGFVRDPETSHAGLHILQPQDPMHFVCRGPADQTLLMVDHAPDAGDPALLAPALPGDWTAVDSSGASIFPDRDDAPLYVRHDPAVRQVIALWLPQSLAAEIDSAVPPSEAEFRPIPEPAIARIVGYLKQGQCRAVADLFYRSSEV